MAQPTAPQNLPELVHMHFEAARESGAITFWPTEVDIMQVNGVPFQLRFCPTLVNKPKADKNSNGKSFDPFLDPPETMLITELPPSHVLVLNKFAIVREHFILATKAFKQQTDLLEPDDLGATYACLKAWRAHEGELFAFFNSGQYSGASQPHRHIQLLPVASMREGLVDSTWKPIVDLMTSDPNFELPFASFSSRLPNDATSEELFKIYENLYECARRTVESYNDKHGDRNVLSQPDGSRSSLFSYNLGMTDKSMVLCPRSADGAMISSAGDKSASIGPISLNGTLLAGTLLVKYKDEWEALRADASQLTNVLARIGIPPNQAEQKL